MVMFGLVMSEDICSKQDRRNEILRGLANLPAMMEKVYRDCFEKDNKIVAASERIRNNKSVIILSRGKSSHVSYHILQVNLEYVPNMYFVMEAIL